MNSRVLTHWTFVALFGVVSLAPATSRSAPKPPTQFCLVWESSLDAKDTWEMNLLIRPVPGKLAAHFAGVSQSRAVLKFWELHGMASKPSAPYFHILTGTGWAYANEPNLMLLAVTSGQTQFEGYFNVMARAGNFNRTTPDGSVTSGTFTLRPCADVEIND
jgi:hypothetical protein